MNSILIQASQKTPYIKLDFEKGSCTIKGTSIPNNAHDFYKPLLNGIDSYLKNPQDQTKIDIQFEYLNTDSSKCILEMFKKWEALLKLKKSVKVHWHYKDQDMLSMGENYKMIIQLPFEMLPVSI